MLDINTHRILFLYKIVIIQNVKQLITFEGLFIINIKIFSFFETLSTQGNLADYFAYKSAYNF